MSGDVAVGHDPARWNGVNKVKDGAPTSVIAGLRHERHDRGMDDIAVEPAEQPITAQEVRRLTVATIVTVVLLVAYWALWFGARSAIASNTTGAYYDFENAFPAADAWLAVCVVLALRATRARRPTALFWLLAGGGAGIYLFAMDALYDVEHGIYGRGAGGLVELAINLVTFALSAWFLTWAWRRRFALLT